MNKYFKILSLLCIATLVLTKNSDAQSFPRIGDTWESSTGSDGMLYLPPPYGFKDKIEFEYKGMKFDGAVKDGKILFISTIDSLFEINKTKYIGKPLSFFKNKDNVKLVLGWAHYLPVEEGWYAAFSFKKLTDSSKVIFLFQVENSIVTR